MLACFVPLSNGKMSLDSCLDDRGLVAQNYQRHPCWRAGALHPENARPCPGSAVLCQGLRVCAAQTIVMYTSNVDRSQGTFMKRIRHLAVAAACLVAVMAAGVAWTAPPPSASGLFVQTPSAEVQQFLPRLDKGVPGLRSWKELEGPLNHSLAYARRWPAHELAAPHGLPSVTWGRVVATLELLRKLLPRLDAEPDLLNRHFVWYAMNPDPRFTGYYSPVIEASPVRTAAFPYPLYRLPEEIAPHLAACLPSHSCPDEAFSPAIVADPPHQTRAAIDLDKTLDGRGLEMAWLPHPADVYHLMLEGSGLLRFPDGTIRAALFAGLNGHKGRGIAGTLMRQHKVSAKDTTHEGVRRWWDANPHKRRALLEEVPSYVFFRFGGAEPQGSIGSGLIPWVSLAVDEKLVPLGSLLAFGLAPDGRHGPKRYGLAFAQDTGQAIVRQRVDLYTGAGPTGRQQALQINHPGDLWMLVIKE